MGLECPKLTVAVVERFLGHRTPLTPEQCWPWVGAKRSGYGRLQIDGRTHGAHRLAYLIRYDEWPGDRFVCHSCDNPACVNPSHLWLGTHDDNMEDKLAKSHARAKGLARKPWVLM